MSQSLKTLVFIGIVVLIAACVIYYFSHKESFEKEQNLSSKKLECAEIGRKVYDEEVSDFSKFIGSDQNKNTYWREPEYAYNSDLKTCLLYTHVTTPLGDKEHTIEIIKDTLSNNNLYMFSHVDKGGRHEIPSCEGRPTDEKTICIDSEEKFKRIKTDLFYN